MPTTQSSKVRPVPYAVIIEFALLSSHEKFGTDYTSLAA